MKTKKERLDRFIAKLMEDDLLWKKFRGKKQIVKETRGLAPSMIEGMNPELQAIEKMFTPGQGEEHDEAAELGAMR